MTGDNQRTTNGQPKFTHRTTVRGSPTFCLTRSPPANGSESELSNTSVISRLYAVPDTHSRLLLSDSQAAQAELRSVFESTCCS